MASTQEILATARFEGRLTLTEEESKNLIREAGLPTTELRSASSVQEAVAAADELGYPVVLKILSTDISHKTDVGGVVLNLGDAAAVSQAYNTIVETVAQKQPGASVQGVSVQPMAAPGVEVVIGMYKDAPFGPVLMFGLGGILIEVLRDVSFRLVPLIARDAQEMIREIKGFPVLNGFRGQPPVDQDALQRMLLQVSSFVEAHPEIAEIDMNPILVSSDGAIAVDARVVLEQQVDGG